MKKRLVASTPSPWQPVARPAEARVGKPLRVGMVLHDPQQFGGLEDYAATLGMGESFVVEEGNQWRALAAGGDVGWAEVGDDGNAQARGDDIAVADLECSGAAVVEDRLAMATH